MYKKPFHLLLIALMCFSLPLSAQDDDEKEISGGFTSGVHFTNSGWGVSLDYLKGPDRQQLSFGLSIFSIRDMREAQIEPFFGNRGRRYVFGKINNFWVLAPTIGILKNAIPRINGNLLNVRLGAEIGPAVGLLNPYYLEIFEPSPSQPFVGDRVVTPYDPSEHTYSKIVGRAGLLASEINLSTQIGLHANVHAMMDFAKGSRYINGLQLGVNANLFAKEVIILAEMDKLTNRQFFIAGSLGFIFGNRW